MKTLIAVLMLSFLAAGCTTTRSADTIADLKAALAAFEARLNQLEFNAHVPHGTERVTQPMQRTIQ